MPPSPTSTPALTSILAICSGDYQSLTCNALYPVVCCWDQLVLACKSQLFNFQAFCKPALKPSVA